MVGTSVKAIVGYKPVTIGAITLISWYLAANGIRFTDVFVVHPFNPFLYVGGLFFHEDWSHFLGNLRFLLPFGVVLTWLTSNRHVFGVVVVAEILSQLVSVAIGQAGVGLSGTVFALAAALLVRSTGIAADGASPQGIGMAVAGVFAPVAFGFLLVAIVAGGHGGIAHFSHFFGLLFGGSIEAVYIVSEAEKEPESEQEVGGGKLPGKRRW